MKRILSFKYNSHYCLTFCHSQVSFYRYGAGSRARADVWATNPQKILNVFSGTYFSKVFWFSILPSSGLIHFYCHFFYQWTGKSRPLALMLEVPGLRGQCGTILTSKTVYLPLKHVERFQIGHRYPIGRKRASVCCLCPSMTLSLM